MSNVFDIIKQHTVIVDGGSGVLVQPMTDEYSYILTAKHNLLNDYNNDQSGVKELSQIDLMTFGDEKLTAIYVYDHQYLDIAVIKIDFRQGIEVYPYQKIPRADDSVRLYGYPGIKRAAGQPASDQIENYHLVIHEPLNERISFRNHDMAPVEDVKGFSGGGLFHVDEDLDKAFLVGIENAMDSTRALHERVKGIPISAFSDLLADNGLAPLKPLHLTNFKQLCEHVFPVNYYEHLADFQRKDIDRVVGLIKRDSECVAKLIESTPLDILTRYRSQLEVTKRDKSELENEALWCALLELVVLTSITKRIKSDEIDISTLFDGLFEECRVIYIDSDKHWKTCYEEILTSSTSHLNSNGKIILIMGSEPMVGGIIPAEDIGEYVENISSAYAQDAIDNARRFSEKKFPIIHWVSLHDQCIFSQRDDFKQYNSILQDDEDNNRLLLKKKYQPYLLPQGGDDD